MQENSELHSDDSKPEDGEYQTKPRPTGCLKADHQHACALGRGACEAWHVGGIAADDPVHDDDVCRFTSVPASTKSMTLRSTRSASAASRNSSPVSASYVGVSSTLTARALPALSLDLDGPDAAPHLEKRPAFEAALLHYVSDSSRGSVEALAPVALCLPACVFLTEDRR